MNMWYKVPNASKYSINRETQQIRNDKTGRILRTVPNNCGYIHACLICDDKKPRTTYVHRIIAELFVHKPVGATVVNHKNFIKHDNSEANLEWTTPTDNVHHFWDKSDNDKATAFRKRWDKNERRLVRTLQGLHRKFKGLNIQQQLELLATLEALK